MSSINPLLQISEERLTELEQNLTWTFTSVGTVGVPNLLFSEYAQILNESFLGQHLGIITDRRGSKIVTNFEIHHDREDYLFCEKYKNGWLYFLRKLVLGRLFVQFGNKQPIVITDLPAANFASAILTQSTPQSRVLIFVRDGREVLSYKTRSLLGSEKSLHTGLATFSQANLHEFLKLEARKWVKMVSILLDVRKNHDKSLTKFIKFEDLLKDPTSEIGKILEFININITNNEVEKLASKIQKKLEPSTNIIQSFDWRQNSSVKEKAAIDEIMKETLEKLNY